MPVPIPKTLVWHGSPTVEQAKCRYPSSVKGIAPVELSLGVKCTKRVFTSEPPVRASKILDKAQVE
ncbi:hypothetical protein HAX54_034175, partial [Datura stramonium]|nr:hypothetical protein [Datura stramonium]